MIYLLRLMLLPRRNLKLGIAWYRRQLSKHSVSGLCDTNRFSIFD